MKMDRTYPLVPIANFIGCFLVFVSSIGLCYRPWNTGVQMFALYVFVRSLVVGINTIVWSDNINDKAPVWCDITTHFFVFSDAAIPACIFVITHRLFKIVSFRSSLTSASEHEKRMIVIRELLICLGFPLVITGIYYVVQGTRYNILEEIGCLSSAYQSGKSFILISLWGILPPVVSFFFHMLVYTLYRHKKQMAKFLDSTGSSLQGDIVRPLVLFCVVALPLLLSFTVRVAALVGTYRRFGPNFVFWPSWEEIHSNWGPGFETKSDWEEGSIWTLLSVRYFEWISPLFAVGFFVIFGLSREARRRYQIIYWATVNPCGLRPTKPAPKVRLEPFIRFRSVRNNAALTSSTFYTESEATLPNV